MTNKKHYILYISILEEYYDTFIAIISDLNFNGVVEGMDVLEFYFEEENWNDEIENKIKELN